MSMIKIENVEVWGFKGAIRGMRNPKNSWDRSDSDLCADIEPKDCRNHDGELSACGEGAFCIGLNDLKLMKQLRAAGTEHRKYLRMIHVQMDIVAPFYWWKEFDTYKIGTTANSCSTMHKLTAKPFELEDFSTDHLTKDSMIWMQNTVIQLNYWRDCYLVNKDKDCWWQMIQLLPSSYNQRRTIDMDYETVLRILQQREGHKLDEWRDLCLYLYTMLPWAAEIFQEELR